MYAVTLLLVSNIFMTFAWYGHLKYPKSAMWAAILVSWLIALAEYCFQVPANRIGNTIEGFSAPQLKIIQEVITLIVFTVFSILVLKQPPRWNDAVAFFFIAVGVFFSVYFRSPSAMTHG